MRTSESRAPKRTALTLAAALGLLGCSRSAEGPGSADLVKRPATVATGPSASVKGSPRETETSADAAPTKPRFSWEEALALLFPEARSLDETGCALGGVEDDTIRCLIGARYADDARGLETARAFFEETGSIPGVEREHTMDGGFRGSIHIVPERPIGRYQRHFDWVLEAQRDVSRVFEGIEAKKTHEVRYRVLPIGWKFMRSVGRTTPSAYASDFLIGYNVSGSLNTSMEAIRDTLVHEVFHANDAEAGNWSRETLGRVFDGIVAKCGTRIACLKPYAPMKTIVKNGTYYAFQPGNGDAVHEYAAELSSRYFVETRAAMRGDAAKEKPFKCGPGENAEAWKAMVERFFGGVDLSPRCGG